MSNKRNNGANREAGPGPQVDSAADDLADYLASLSALAAHAGAERTEAIDRVLEASLWVIGEEPGDPPATSDDPSVIDPSVIDPSVDEDSVEGPGAGPAVRIAQLRQDDGSTIVPAFTSEKALRSFGGGDAPALEMAGAVLFASCGEGATFVINPGAPGSLTVGAAELSGRPRAVVREKDGRPHVAATPPSAKPPSAKPPSAKPPSAKPPPAKPPSAKPPSAPVPESGAAREAKTNVAMLLLALRDALEDCPTVKAGFAGNFVAEGRERTVVGLELERESDPDPVVRRVADALEDVGPSDAAVDLILLDRSPGPLTDALRKGEPFYRRG